MTKPKRDAPPETRYRFFLNPDDEHVFTTCPKCEAKTSIRKFPLAIHIEPHQLFLLNKKCRFCPDCELVIAKESEIETLVVEAVETRVPDLIGNDYIVFGTMDRKIGSNRGRARSIRRRPSNAFMYSRTSGISRSFPVDGIGKANTRWSNWREAKARSRSSR